MLREAMKKVQISKEAQTPAGKTSNMYRLIRNYYLNLLAIPPQQLIKKRIKPFE